MDFNSKQGSESEFNQAVAQVNRIAELINELNLFNKNLKHYNSIYGSYNYILKLDNLNSIFNEIVAKLSDEEEEQTSKEIEELKEFIETHPVYVTKKNEGFGSSKTITYFNRGYFNTIERKLNILDRKMRKLVDKSGFGSPSKKDVKRAVLNQG